MCTNRVLKVTEHVQGCTQGSSTSDLEAWRFVTGYV